MLIHFKFYSFNLGQTRIIPKTVVEKCANPVLCIVICALLPTLILHFFSSHFR